MASAPSALAVRAGEAMGLEAAGVGNSEGEAFLVCDRLGESGLKVESVIGQLGQGIKDGAAGRPRG